MPLEKSYSEHIGLSRHRSPWQRSRSNPVNLQQPNTRPLQPVSQTTKNKLNRFVYDPPHVVDDATNQEPMGKPQAGDQPIPSKEAANNTTMTPTMNRLNWKDFMEPNVAAEEDLNDSPNERITWDSRPCPNGVSPLVARDNKKRARSSSPISSPAGDKPKTPAVNVKKLAQALKSPHADPTLELWDRFSLHKNDKSTSTTLGFTNPALAQLMISSSPRPSGRTRNTGDNLRRTMSYGLNAPKRRKVDTSRSCSVASDEQRDMEAASKSSLVSALLENATSSFQDHSPDERMDQSPSLNKRRVSSAACSSPLQDKGQDIPDTDATVSDYGDDDFDDESFMQLEAQIGTSQPNPTARSSKQDAPDTLKIKPGRPEHPIAIEILDDSDETIDELLENNKHRPLAHKNAPVTPAHDTNKPIQAQALQDLDDEFDDFDDDLDLEAVEMVMTQSMKQANHSNLSEVKPKTIQRYLVTNVCDGDFVDERGSARPEKILIIQADGSKSFKTVHLRGSWFDTPAHPQAYVHIIGQFSSQGRCIIDDAENLLILHPDQLISSTVVADSFGCMRRAVLQDRVKATSEASPPLVYGTLLHEIFQEALLENKWDRPFLTKVIEKITDRHVEDLYTIKVSMALAREHLESKMAELSYWATAFVSSQPKDDALVEDRGGKKVNLAVTKLLDVEEHVWSPMYGLKGNIDATVEVAMLEGDRKQTLTVPFEVKTGKHANSNHMAQTALYTLLLSDRYDINISYGILYYMETSKTMRIPAIRHELRHMVMQRNQLACYIRERSVQLPPMLKSKHMCGKCYAKTSCFTYHRLADDGNGESSGMDEKFDELVQHLTSDHQGFFIKWENLLTKEEKESQKTKRELWTMTSAEREKKARCFGDVIIEEGSSSVDTDNPRINRYHYTFVKRVAANGFSFLESELHVGEPIVVSDEEGHFALAIGYITSVKKQRISVAVDRRLHNSRIRQPGFNEVDNQVFASIMEVAHEGSTQDDALGKIKAAPIRYRIDQDEFSNGMATVRNNLVQIMANNVPEATQIRRLVVDLAPPRYKTVATQYTVEAEDLNVDQKRAIEKVMSAQDYALVLGMPGTGKTTTIAHIIRALVSQGKTVLLTSHTHTAVDNILLKLKSDNIPVLRLGAPAKVHPEVQNFATMAGVPMKSFDEIKEAWHGTPVVATTCLGINHQVFNERAFDYCIVDEASQITLPICIGPIRMSRTFVLVGDHNQLPPVVRNEEAREGGLDVSLFKLLSDAHPQSVVNLEHQYRMCEDIMTLSNTLIYDGRLRCGTEAVRTRKLHIPNLGALRQKHYDASTLRLPGTPRSFCTGPVPSRCWLHDVLNSEARVRFLNTDTIQPQVREEAHGKRIVNSAEVRIVSQLVDSLLAIGIPDSEIGVMTHYRSQLFMLKDQLRGYSGVEMHTTDRFQGRDKEVVVLSLVRSNDACNIGDLLKDWRRINVAFTRAKTKLLVVGSKSTLKGSGKENMLSQFITLMEEHDWIYHLPRDALDSHLFELPGTQLTAASPSQREKKVASEKPLLSPKKKLGGAAGKENRRPSPRKATIGERVLLKGKPITRDILNEMTNGAY